MSASPDSPRSDSDVRLSWRNAALWGAFLVTLVVGLVLAARFGGSAPTLIEAVRP